VIVVNAGGDAALQGATITITSTLGGLSTVAATFTMPNPSDSASHRFAVSGIASDWFEVSITGNNGSASVPTVVVCAGFGVESAGSATSSSSGSGANTLEVPFVMARMTTVDNSFLLVGARKVNIAGLTFSNVYFVADLYMTGGATNAEVRLWDTTDGVAITNADVTSTSVTPAEVKSLLVPVGTSAGMLRVDAIKMYQVELHMVGGVLGTDMAFCTNARLVFQ
jgi:hypothetical protein